MTRGSNLTSLFLHHVKKPACPILSTMIASVLDLTVTKYITRLNRTVKLESGAKHEEQMLQQKQLRHVDGGCLVDTFRGKETAAAH